MSKAFIYIIHSDTLDKYYVGCTEDIARRLEEHNRGKSRSTRGGRPWKLVYREEYNTLSEARTREARIKRKKSRSYIEWLINQEDLEKL